MANISILSRLVNSVQRNVDLSTNTLVVSVVKVGGSSGTDLTKSILDGLIALQAGLASTTPGSAGSTLVADNNSYTNFTPTAATVKGALSGIDSALGAISVTPNFSDSAFRLHDNGDATKLMAFEVSAIATGTTRTITMPDANVDLGKIASAIQKDGSVAFTANQPMGSFKLTGLAAGTTTGDSVRYEQAILASGVNAWSGNQSLGGNKITGSADPTSAQDLATKAYVDAVALGLSPKKSARVGTTANITLSGTQTIDTISVVAGDRVLVKNQTSAPQNGIYIVAAGAWSRSTDMNSTTPNDEFNGAWVPVQLGSQAGQIFVQYGTVTTIGTDAVNFEFYNPLASLVGGDMISVTGSTIAVDLAAASGLESSNPGNSAGQLRVKLEASNPSLKFSGSNELAIKFDGAGAILAGVSGTAVQVDNSTVEIFSNALRLKDAGVTLAKMAANSVDESKIVSTTYSPTGAIAGGGGSKVAVQVDNSTLEISSNAVRQKDAGTTAAKLNTNVADQSTIVGGAGTALSVAQAPLLSEIVTVGEAMVANTTFAVRWGYSSETAGRVYKADQDATTSDNFYVIGLVIVGASSLSAGQTATMILRGKSTLGSSDTPFVSGDFGKPLFLTTAGAFSTTAPSTANQAVVRLGTVRTASLISVNPIVVGVN